MKKITKVITCFILVLMLFPIVEASEEMSNLVEEKPDLIIENIIVEEYGHHVPSYQRLCCRVKNIGDASVEEIIFVSVQVYLCLFWFPIRSIGTYEGSINPITGLEPGETIDIEFAYYYDFPIFGFFQFNAKVNPDETIDESNYQNNAYSELDFRFVFWWEEF